MALVISDRVKETTATSGTGTYTLGGAVTGFETFTANLSDGDTTYYACTDNTDFEVGLGTFTTSGTTLARTTILASSNSGSAVNWAAGTRTIFCTLPAAKTVFLDGSNVANISNLKLASGATVTAILDEDTLSSNSDTSLATQQSIKAYVDTQLTAQDLDFQGDTGGALSIDLDSEVLDIAGGTGIDTSGSGNTLTVAIDSTVATLTGSQTLTNKTLTAPVISTISNTGTVTLPTATDTLVARATTDTLTNKTLTSPVLNTSVSGSAFLDDDTFATATASTLASSESIKAYVDTTVAATNEVVEDTTPQLGGDLDLNSNDITGTGNINITGTIQSSGNITGTLATAAQPNITSVGTLTGLDVAGTPTFDGLTIDGVGSIGNVAGLYLDINSTGGTGY